MKTCSKCGETKPLGDFRKRKTSKDGRTGQCKLCCNAYHAEWYQRDLEGNRAKLRAWAEAAGPDYHADRSRRYRKKHPEKARAAGRKSSAALLERQPDYHRKWYRANIEKERARARKVMREARRTNPERARATRKRYRAKNLAVVQMREREKTYARRALQPYSPEIAAHMAELVLRPCAYCPATENITIDHIVPLSRGGKHEIANLNPACLPCNASKNNRLLSEWPGRF